jgi:hypothetical protein
MPRWQDPPAATGTLPRGEGTSAAFEPTPSALPDEPPLPAEELCGLDRGAGYKGLAICGNSTIGGSTAVGRNTAIASHISIGDDTTKGGDARCRRRSQRRHTFSGRQPNRWR